MALSERYKTGIVIPDAEWEVVFSPVLNIISLFTDGKIISGVTEYWIDTGLNTASNVHTIFGTLYIHLGFAGSIVYIIVLSSGLNLAYWYALKSKNCWLSIAVLFLVTLLSFGWFDNYSGNLASIEVPFWALMLCMASRFVRRSPVERV
jgi:hypothetical protein